MKSLETVVAVTHTHTQAVLNNQIASNCKAFNVPKNRGNLEYNRIKSRLCFRFLFAFYNILKGK